MDTRWISAVVVSIAVLSFAFSRAQDSKTPAQGSTALSTSQLKAAMDAEYPAARSEIDEQIHRTSQYDLGTLILALHELGPDYNMAMRAAGDDNAFYGNSVHMTMCLADRRVARLYDFLKAMPAEEARKALDKHFSRSLSMLVETWSGGVKTTMWNFEPPTPRLDVHAVRSIVLMYALTTDAETALEKIEQWGAAMSLIETVTLFSQHREGFAFTIEAMGAPDNLFIAHSLMILLQKENRLTPEVLARAQTLGLPEVCEVDFMHWQSHTSPHDWIHKLSGSPIDQENLLQRFILTKHWDNEETYNSRDAQKGVVNYLKGILLHQEQVDAEPTLADPMR